MVICGFLRSQQEEVADDENEEEDDEDNEEAVQCTAHRSLGKNYT